jgi:hypothetical protein
LPATSRQLPSLPADAGFVVELIEPYPYVQTDEPRLRADAAFAWHKRRGTRQMGLCREVKASRMASRRGLRVRQFSEWEIAFALMAKN